VVGDYVVVVLVEIYVLALFAASLHLLIGPGGMVSFGHAAFFGIGAYAAGLLFKAAGAGMGWSLVAAPLIAGTFALAIGGLCIRLSGVYLAMLTLAVAQIAWSVAVQWLALTGGDNGILGLWPTGVFASRAGYHTLALLGCGAGLLLLRHVLAAPFGLTLQAVRDAPRRAASLGIDTVRQQWLAFGLAGALAGLAGGIHAFAKGSVFPGVLAIPRSVDGLVMVLLGGIDWALGPVIGAALWHVLQASLISATDHWRAALGATILLLVLSFPRGLLGSWRPAAA
jgi:branched-chain amino acid transport system permease protein